MARYVPELAVAGLTQPAVVGSTARHLHRVRSTMDGGREGQAPVPCSRRRPVRFSRAVPRRHDRRELRRTLRAAARELRRERRTRTTARLEALVASHTRVGAVRCDPAGATTVEFVDGTVLDLSVREGEVGLRRLAATTAPVIYLQAPSRASAAPGAGCSSCRCSRIAA